MAEPYCVPPRPCPQPACAFLSTISNPCACPTDIPTSTSYTPCPTACHGTCETFYSTLRSCPTTKPATKPTTTPSITTDPPPLPTTCVTVTETTGSTCPSLSCEVAECIVLSQITQSCGCTSIAHETHCKTACDGSCSMQWSTAYLPCPYTGPIITETIGPADTMKL
jgi:hypothetical protein